MSRLAAERMVQTSCLTRVGSLRCRGCSYNVQGIPAHTHEDAAVGLCMHLCAARLIQCHGFAVAAPPGAETWRAPASLRALTAVGQGPGARLPSTLRVLSTAHHRPSTELGGAYHTRQQQTNLTNLTTVPAALTAAALLPAVGRMFNDHVPAGQERCAHMCTHVPHADHACTQVEAPGSPKRAGLAIAIGQAEGEARQHTAPAHAASHSNRNHTRSALSPYSRLHLHATSCHSLTSFTYRQ